MKWTISIFAMVALASAALAQTPWSQPGPQSTPVVDAAPQPGLDGSGEPHWYDASAERSNRLAGNHNFDNFIGFLSNPLTNIDPRAVTALYPIFLYNTFSTSPALPSGDFVLPPAAGLTVAVTDRLAVGLNQGGYVFVDLDRNRPGRFADRLGRLRDRREFSGEREGWLNIGGFVQYTLIEDVPNQFLLSTGLRCVVPTGSKALFQGQGPAILAPYATIGKEFGHFHVLATVGYQFPAGTGKGTDIFYGCLHIDRQTFGWLYPLVEFNFVQSTTNVEIDLPTRRGFFDLGGFQTNGNLLAISVGANVVLIPSKLEFGAVYSTPLSTQRNFDFNGLLVKMVYRF